MKLTIDKVKVSIDHITVTSDDRRRNEFDPETIQGYRYFGFKPTKGTEESKMYRVFHEYRNEKTRNKVHIFTDREEAAYYLPNLTVKFFPTWEHKLKYSEIIRVLNYISERHNVAFNLSQYHVAIDIFSERNYLDRLVAWMKSGRHWDPEGNPNYPGTYYFHAQTSIFGLIAYDKKKQVFQKYDLNKEYLSRESKRELRDCNITRIEARFRETSSISSLAQLATHNFKNLIPRHIDFLLPDKAKLIRQGIAPRHYKGIGLKELRKLLKKKGVKHNFFYYTKRDQNLIDMVVKAVIKFRWCDSPLQYPVYQPKTVIRPQGIKFTKQE